MSAAEKVDTPRELTSEEKVDTLRHLLKDRENRVLGALEEFFNVADALARTRTEEVAREHRELANVRAQINTLEARIAELGKLRREVREEAAKHLVERDEKKVKELQRRYESLGDDQEAARLEAADLRGRLHNFAGVPGSVSDLTETNSAYRGALRREADSLLKRLQKIHRDRCRKLTSG